MAERNEKKKPAASTGNDANLTLSLSDIKELFSLMKDNEIAEVNLEHKDTKIHIVSTHAPTVVPQQTVGQMVPMMHSGMSLVPTSSTQQHETFSTAPSSPSTPPADAAAEKEAAAPSNLKTIHSPMVGTFYRSPAPDAPPFIQVGEIVNEETVLCIIEAMKLMNEIKAEMKGRIQKIIVENGNPVEYNQPLFLIEPA